MVTKALEATQHATFQRRAEGAGQLTLLQLGHVRMQGAPWGCRRGVPGAGSHQGDPPPTPGRPPPLTQECGVPGHVCQLCILESPGEVSCWFLTF